MARHLGIEAMSLYHHVANKEALLDGMVDVVFGEIHHPAVGADWRGGSGPRYRSAREGLKRHPWAIGLMDSRRRRGPMTLHHHDAVLGCLRGARALGGRWPAHAVAVLDAHLYGFLIQEVALPFAAGDDLAEITTEMLPACLVGRWPTSRSSPARTRAARATSSATSSRWGLELVLDGLADRLAAQPRVGEAARLRRRGRPERRARPGPRGRGGGGRSPAGGGGRASSSRVAALA